jgi:long-chain acyl-CoA synthetase
VYAAQHASAHAEQPAIIMGGSAEVVTFRQYEDGCNQIARLLRAAGLRRGDHIAVFMENSPQMLMIEGAAERIGLYYSLINTYLSPDEVAYIISNSRSRILFSSTARQLVAAQAAAQCPALERLLMTGSGAPPPGWESFEKALAAFPPDPVSDRSLGVAMPYSAGTTGQPKGVLRPLPEGPPADCREHEAFTSSSPAPQRLVSAPTEGSDSSGSSPCCTANIAAPARPDVPILV